MSKLSIIGETMIFRKDHEYSNGTFATYSTGISRKQEDGSYKNKYKEVKFRKGVSIPDKTIINIKDGFLTFREYMAPGGDMKDVEYIMVLDFEIVSGKEPEHTGFTQLQDEELPF